jgi:hypothetical protein
VSKGCITVSATRPDSAPAQKVSIAEEARLEEGEDVVVEGDEDEGAPAPAGRA